MPRRFSFLSWIRFPRASGIGPVSLFPPRSSLLRFAKLPRVSGIEPVSSFPLRSSFLRQVRLPRASGIGPVKSLSIESQHFEVVRFPRASGIGPVKCVTPYHVPSGSSVITCPRNRGNLRQRMPPLLPGPGIIIAAQAITATAATPA